MRLKINQNKFSFHKRGINKFKIERVRVVKNGYPQADRYYVQQEIKYPKWMFWKRWNKQPTFFTLKYTQHSKFLNGYKYNIENGQKVSGHPFKAYYVGKRNVDVVNEMIQSGEIVSVTEITDSWNKCTCFTSDIRKAERWLEEIQSQYMAIHREERLSKILKK